MCGICGMFGIFDTAGLGKMVSRLNHRGPDDKGFFFYEENNVALGHTRLSIIDLSESGNQPMYSSNGSHIIVYNGEVYNYLEIRKELESKGYIFRTLTDTEVVLNSYLYWGDQCLSKFNGMFAFAIWDRSKKELFCARDRLGVKPFYYFYCNGKFAFASEIKPLLELECIRKKPNNHMIYDYMVDGYVEHTDQTFFKNIYKLMPGCYAYISLEEGMHIEKYWDISINDEIRNTDDSHRIIDEFRNLFIDSVKLRLRSDVPVGSCLSGGLDSSAIVCVVNNFIKEKMQGSSIGERQKTFSSCFEDLKFDERKYIEAIAQKTLSDKNYIFPNSDDLINDLTKLIYQQEEPFLGTSIFAQWRIMKTVKESGITVLLDGQGADELLGGYRKYKLFMIKQLMGEKRYSAAYKEIIGGLLQNNRAYNFTMDFQKIKKILGAGTDTKMLKYIHKNFKLDYGCTTEHVFPQNLSESLYLDLRKYSLPALLRYEDKNSMSFSVEARLPFLDYRLVEYSAKLPLAYKLNNGWSKWVLRQAMKGIVPDRIIDRRDKMGFVTSEKKWINEKREYFRKVFENKNFLSSDYLNNKDILKDFDNIINGAETPYLWRFINLEIWMQLFFN